MERTILHCDLNNFYASVACRDNPSLRDRPVAVCGDQKERHGIVLAKNAAARAYGVATGEAIWQAKSKCPGLVTVLPDFNRYTEFSVAARKIYKDYSDLLEPFGPDEAWIDVSGSRLIFGNGLEIANKIRKRIREELGLTISVGVSFNKVFAKLGSDLKKPDAVTVISPDNFKEIVWQLPANAMIGVGNATYRLLCSVGIHTIGQLGNAPDALLKRILGKSGEQLKLWALGLDTSRVAEASYHRTPKSIGRSTTCAADLVTLNDVWKTMLMLSEEVGAQLRTEQAEATGVQLHLRTNELKVNELQSPLEMPTQSGIVLAKRGIELFKAKYEFLRPLRSLGIRAINLIPQADGAQQIGLFQNAKSFETLQKIETQMDTLHRRFGKDCICRGSVMHEKKAASEPRPFSQIYK